MQTDIHYYFADFFPDPSVKPYAYLLSKKLLQGHICIPLQLKEETPFEIPNPAALRKHTSGLLGHADQINAPFIIDQDFIYLQRYYKYELNIFNQIVHRLQWSQNNRSVYETQLLAIKTFIQEAFGDANVIVNGEPDWQIIAVLRCMTQQLGIITGGPGTGKTTTLAKLLQVLYAIQPECRVALAAPTGKASMRMVESLRQRSNTLSATLREKIDQLKPHTLHALLGYQSNSVYFRHNKENNLPYDCVVVDEASMIDVPMFSKLLDACALNTRLILLGDKDQLASVEAGSLLGDLCLSAGKLNLFREEESQFIQQLLGSDQSIISDQYKLDKTPLLSSAITELRHSHRFSKESDIGQLSRAIISGDIEKTQSMLKGDKKTNISFIDFTDEKSFENFIEGYVRFLEQEDPEKALVELNHLRVLVTVREGTSGLYFINQKIEKILSENFPRLIKPHAGFYHNQPVIVTKNNYELGLYNGDIGIIRKEDGSNRLRAWFETSSNNKLRSFNPAYLSNCETAFAMTIHKSQGSEFNEVMVILPEQTDNQLLSRELLYTGITRARNKVIIMGNENILSTGVAQKVERFSGLQSRFQHIEKNDI